MSKNTEEVRSAIENSLQGLAFWMGYRNTTYYKYVFTEYSLVDEFSSLLKSLLGKEYIIKREEKYSNHFPEIKKGDKMDLFITDKNGKKYAVIEVKRWRVRNRTTEEGDEERRYISEREIEKDIIKLAEVKKGNNDIPCFFILISERARPAKYVGERGNAVKKKSPIKGYDDLEYSTRVLKSSASFEKKENAYYCCLVEIFKKARGKGRP